MNTAARDGTMHERVAKQLALPRCETCIFWQELDPEDEGQAADGGYEVTDFGVGLCRRNPPIGPRLQSEVSAGGRKVWVDAIDAANAAAWPVTWAEDWCGQHRREVVVLPEDEARAISAATAERYRRMSMPGPEDWARAQAAKERETVVE